MEGKKRLTEALFTANKIVWKAKTWNGKRDELLKIKRERLLHFARNDSLVALVSSYFMLLNFLIKETIVVAIMAPEKAKKISFCASQMSPCVPR